MKSLPIVLLLAAVGCTAVALSAYVIAGRHTGEVLMEADTFTAQPHGLSESENLEKVRGELPNQAARSRIGVVQQWEVAETVELSRDEDECVAATVPASNVKFEHGFQVVWSSDEGIADAPFDPTRLIGKRSSERSRSSVTQRITASLNGVESIAPVKKAKAPALAEQAKLPKETKSRAEVTQDQVQIGMESPIANATRVGEFEDWNRRRSWRRGGFSPEEELHRAQVGWHAFAAEIFEVATVGAPGSAP